MLSDSSGPTETADFRQQRTSYFNVKGKAFPLQGWTGPEGFRRFRLPDFKTIGT